MWLCTQYLTQDAERNSAEALVIVIGIFGTTVMGAVRVRLNLLLVDYVGQS